MHGKSIASARAGNVIGGGDWAKDRIIPDCIKAIESGVITSYSIHYTKLYENPRTFINVYLGIIKTVSINVIGEVFAPGTYTLPGTASAFNALYLAGGPNVNGSFRNIQVIRGGKVLSTLDVYDYLINGNTTMNLPLRDDDVILVRNNFV